mmetsp:Transcript_83841/g.180875  ORF Transcript_83841/g.180875 Transcript_83841/m.180875 type:complete len:81 (-) Transcript_83841:28-270(-)
MSLDAIQLVQEYTFQVMDALAVRNGPCHIELKLHEQGVTLIELNARFAGDVPRCREVNGCDQCELFVWSLVDPVKFQQWQ